MEVRSSRPEDGVEAFLREHNADRVARLGVLEDALAHPHLVALDPGLAGVLTYVLRDDDCEVLTLHATRRRHGAGTALLEAVRAIAGDRRLWLITTNDNVDALRFYQRRGFRLAKLHANAVDDARERLKPEIPRIGNYGIPLRDELELEG
ncbi:GNAT family N-acetyltransferase [Solirubrobacter ginsenosidimutans]|uniref:GNAT family N-acetyltransferase n=1 Tax=Solirubrobacter ginsenosidimutans TaxID=490573 RepID=A0A9X3MV55_9ACTN|nr:GNAT family N-acetyltransferase [Solirubrobacter ginsenosidimutans]MDA0161857.1 GNAT family N-acetyltransferase [Solirubrobacter ginsenosidimutans]